MGYTTVFGSGRKSNMVRNFVVDTFDDIASIDISQLLAGSTAFVITTSETYMLKNDRTWYKVNIGSGGGGSGGDIIYDGGDEDGGSTTERIYDGGDEDG